MDQFEFSITDNLRGFDLKFKTTCDLFSYKKVDEGTRLLVNALEIGDGDVCLDLGCGYGPLGIVMAKMNSRGKIYLVDRDFVATKFAKLNCELNNVRSCDVRLSDSFSELTGIKFDVVAANLPSHQAKLALRKMIYEAGEALKKEGKFFVVIVSRLKNYIRKELGLVFGTVEKLVQNKKYAVLLATKE